MNLIHPCPHRTANATSPRQIPERRRAFTLIELLVVITIIAVLTGMMLTGINLVRSQARQTKCLSSLRQIGLAADSYSSDWEGILPRLRDADAAAPAGLIFWFEHLAPYLEIDQADRDVIFTRRSSTPLWGCPEWPKDGATSLKPGYGMVWCAYLPTSGASSNFVGNPSARDLVRSQISHAGRRLLVGDAADWNLGYNGLSGYLNPRTACAGTINEIGGNRNWDPARHQGRACYLFFDLHVQPLGAEKNVWLGENDPSSPAWSP